MSDWSDEVKARLETLAQVLGYETGSEESRDLRAALGEIERSMKARAALQEALGSHNAENPWLGICAAVALLKMDREAAEAKLAEAQAILDSLRTEAGRAAFAVANDLLLPEEGAALRAKVERLRDQVENLLHRMTSEEAARDIERLRELIAGHEAWVNADPDQWVMRKDTALTPRLSTEDLGGGSRDANHEKPSPDRPLGALPSQSLPRLYRWCQTVTYAVTMVGLGEIDDEGDAFVTEEARRESAEEWLRSAMPCEYYPEDFVTVDEGAVEYLGSEDIPRLSTEEEVRPLVDLPLVKVRDIGGTLGEQP